MAIQWGGWDYGGGNGMRVGIDVDVTSVSHGSNTVRFDYDVYTQNQYNYADPQKISFSGSYSGGDDVSFTNSGGHGDVTKRASKSYTYTYSGSSYGSSPGSVSFGASLSGAYNGVTPSKSVSTRIPARPYDDPTPVTGFSATRNSDSQITLAWTNHATSGEPYSSITIERSINGSSYASLASLSGSTHSAVTKDKVAPNNRYQYRVRANNSAGSSGWAYSAIVYTTPGAPSGSAAVMMSNGRIRLTWDNTSRYTQYSTRIERSVGGGAWTAVATVGDGVTTWDDPSPGAGVNGYRLKAVSDVGGLSSAYNGGVGGVSTVPLAPSLVKAALQSNASVKVTWKNNSVYTGYTVFVERSVNAGAWVVVASGLASGSTSWTDTAPGGGTNSYRVRARGIASQYSAYAVSNTVNTITPPLAPTGLSPTGLTRDLAQQNVFIWTHVDGGDGADQTAFEIRFSSNNGTSWTTFAGTSALSVYALPAGSLPNGSAYIWQVRTKGLDPNFGPWSGSATLTASSYPTVVAGPRPPATLLTYPVPVDWSYSQPEGRPQAIWEVELYAPFFRRAPATYTTPEWAAYDAPAVGATTISSPSAGRIRSTIASGVSGGATWKLPVATPTGRVRATFSLQALSGALLADRFVVLFSDATGPLGSGDFSLRGLADVRELIVETDADRPVTQVSFYVADVDAGAPPTVIELFDVRVREVTVPVDFKFNSGTASTTTFTYPVLDGASYEVGVRAQSSAGLYSRTSYCGFVVDLIPPAPTTLTPAYDPDTGVVSVLIESADPVADVTAEVLSVDVQRRINGGDWVTIVRGVAPGETVLDTAAATHGLNEYRGSLLSSAPSTGQTDIAALPIDGVATGQRLFLSYGDGFGVVVRAAGDVKTKVSVGRARGVLAAAGRRFPLLQVGASRSRVLDVSASIAWGDRCGRGSESSSREDFESAALEAGVVLYRDFTGRRVFGQLGDLSVDDVAPGYAGVSFSVTEVDYVEVGYVSGTT